MKALEKTAVTAAFQQSTTVSFKCKQCDLSSSTEKTSKQHTGMKHRFQESVKLSNQTGVKKFSTARMNLEITKQLVAQSDLRARTAMWTI